MATPKEFLQDFVRDIVADPAHRMEYLAGYIRLMELREEAIKGGVYGEV